MLAFLARDDEANAGTGGVAAEHQQERQHKHRREVLGGLMERVTVHNEENGFCVLRVKARGLSAI